MNRYGAVLVVLALGAGYLVGFTHGGERAQFEARPEQVVSYAPWPYAAVCSDMLEAAWSVEDVVPAPTLPHGE